MSNEVKNGNTLHNWQTLPLSEVAKVRYGKAKPKVEGEIPVIGSGGIYGYTEKPLIEFETIVIGRKGSAGSTYYCQNPSFPSDTTFYLEWKQKVEVPFIHNFLKFRSLVSDNSIIPSLQRETVENFQIKLPPLPEQKAIAKVLRSVQEAKEARQTERNLERERKNALMDYLFTHGTRGESLQQTEIGEMPESWETVKIDDLAKVKYGKANPKDAGEFAVVGSSGVYSSTSKPLVNFPTIVIGRKGTAGTIWLMKEPCFPSDTTFYLEWKTSDYNLNYIASAMKLRPLSGKHAQTTIPSVLRPDLENYRLPFPSVEEQKEIAEVLQACDEKISALENEINLLNEFFKAILEELMGGKVSTLSLIE